MLRFSVWHTGEVVSLLQFITVMEVTDREMHEGFLWELLFSDAEGKSGDGLRQKLLTWKFALEVECLLSHSQHSVKQKVM